MCVCVPPFGLLMTRERLTETETTPGKKKGFDSICSNNGAADDEKKTTTFSHYKRFNRNIVYEKGQQMLWAGVESVCVCVCLAHVCVPK